jgi:AraC-like DNA-binding protein
VSAIAARWGLIDAAHFGRLFRAAYGLPPAEYRLTASTWNSPGTEPDEAARSAPGFSRPVSRNDPESPGASTGRT